MRIRLWCSRRVRQPLNPRPPGAHGHRPVLRGRGNVGRSQDWGARISLAINHWDVAIRSHSGAHPEAEHVLDNVKRMTNERIRRMLDMTLLLASPSCVNHSLAKGAKTLKEKAMTLFEAAADPELAECGPLGLAEAEKSRATVNDVARFAEQKALAGRPYLGIIVENVVEMIKHGIDEDGRYYRRWRNRILKAGYDHEVVYHNSMFAPPVTLPGHPLPRFVLLDECCVDWWV